jgi:hypothetical protein
MAVRPFPNPVGVDAHVDPRPPRCRRGGWQSARSRIYAKRDDCHRPLRKQGNLFPNPVGSTPTSPRVPQGVVGADGNPPVPGYTRETGRLPSSPTEAGESVPESRRVDAHIAPPRMSFCAPGRARSHHRGFAPRRRRIHVSPKKSLPNCALYIVRRKGVLPCDPKKRVKSWQCSWPSAFCWPCCPPPR